MSNQYVLLLFALSFASASQKIRNVSQFNKKIVIYTTNI